MMCRIKNSSKDTPESRLCINLLSLIYLKNNGPLKNFFPILYHLNTGKNVFCAKQNYSRLRNYSLIIIVLLPRNICACNAVILWIRQSRVLRCLNILTIYFSLTLEAIMLLWKISMSQSLERIFSLLLGLQLIGNIFMPVIYANDAL